MRVARKKPGEPWELVEIENTLEALQAEVGGYIEVVTICDNLVLVLNEEGAINGSRFNFRWGHHQLFGTLLFCGVDGDEFTDVPEAIIPILPT